MVKPRRRRSLAAAICLLLAQASAAGAGQEASGAAPEESEPWALVELLAGHWKGEIDGKLGTGTAVREYRLLMNDRFMLCRHRSVRLPSRKSPQGDEHEEIGIFSFDSQRKTIVYREFMTEGVVVRSPCSVTGMTLVCTSEAVESGPGIRARLTIEIASRYRFTERYELAFPGQELELYFTNRWTRSAALDDWD